MDIVKVQKDLEAYLCSNNRVRLVLINTNTSRYQMIVMKIISYQKEILETMLLHWQNEFPKM